MSIPGVFCCVSKYYLQLYSSQVGSYKPRILEMWYDEILKGGRFEKMHRVLLNFEI